MKRVLRRLARIAAIATVALIGLPVALLVPAAVFDQGPTGAVRASLFPMALTLWDPFVWTCARNSLIVAAIVAAVSLADRRGAGAGRGPVAVLGPAAARGPGMAAAGDVAGHRGGRARRTWSRPARVGRWLGVEREHAVRDAGGRVDRLGAARLGRGRVGDGARGAERQGGPGPDRSRRGPTWGGRSGRRRDGRGGSSSGRSSGPRWRGPRRPSSRSPCSIPGADRPRPAADAAVSDRRDGRPRRRADEGRGAGTDRACARAARPGADPMVGRPADRRRPARHRAARAGLVAPRRRSRFSGSRHGSLSGWRRWSGWSASPSVRLTEAATRAGSSRWRRSSTA